LTPCLIRRDDDRPAYAAATPLTDSPVWLHGTRLRV
jgi:hypothetical protein